MDHIERRRFLTTLSAGATMLIPGWALADNCLWMPDDLPPTPQQTEGPYYPQPTIEQQLHNDTDLCRKLPEDALAKGQAVKLVGVIKNRKGKPINKAIVEVWQASSDGRYNHKRDERNPVKLDKNFQYWGRAITGKDGRYEFTTIIPGKYPGREARHIHYRVDASGYRRCSTQCYFSDYGEDNMRDGLYLQLDKKEREILTVELDKSKPKKATTKQTDKMKPPAKSGDQAGTKKLVTSAVTGKAIDTPWHGLFDIVLQG